MTRHWLSRALLVCRSCVKVGSSICHSCIARASAQVVVVGPSLLYRCSVYWTRGHSSARPSPRIMVASPAALFASRPSDRPSLLCLFVRRLSGTSPSLVRVVDPSLVFLLESSLSYRCLVASPLGSTGHCVRFGSAVQFYTPRGTAVQFYTPRGTVPFDSPCAHSYSICWLRLAATLFTHTLSHAWCPVTLLSLTRCPTVVVLRAS